MCSFSEGLLCLLIFGNKAGINHRLITFRITILNEVLILCFVIIIFTTTGNMCHPNTLFFTHFLIRHWYNKCMLKSRSFVKKLYKYNCNNFVWKSSHKLQFLKLITLHSLEKQKHKSYINLCLYIIQLFFVNAHEHFVIFICLRFLFDCTVCYETFLCLLYTFKIRLKAIWNCQIPFGNKMETTKNRPSSCF